MTNAERHLLGDALDDTSPIVNYGPTEIDFDINAGYVQPVWLCIDTARWQKFGCREMRQIDRRVGAQGKMDLDKVGSMLDDVTAGINTEAIGRKYGVSSTTVKDYAKMHGVKMVSNRKNYKPIGMKQRFTIWADTVQTFGKGYDETGS